MENMEFWNQCNQPPPWALKKIQAGRLKGKSDISPQWRYQVLTEMFGPCGIGWKFTVDKLWTESGSHDQIFAFAQISLFVRIEEKWSEPIPGTGGSMLVAKEKSGLYSSDEAYKMSITDALSTACKMLGIAADIYAGLFDGAKYANPHQPKSTNGKGDSPKPTEQQSQAQRIMALMNDDKAPKDLQKHYTDNLKLIKSFPDELQRQISKCYWARKKAIEKQEANSPPIPTPDSTGVTPDPKNEEEIPPSSEEDLPPIFDESPPGEPTAREKKIIETKEYLDSASKEQLPEFMASLKSQLDKMPLDDQSVIRDYYETLMNKTS